MQSTALAQALLRDVADKLQIRFPTKTLRPAFDANHWPMLFISNGSEAEGASVILFRVSNVDMVSKDVFGNQTYAYSPSLFEIGYELTSGGAPVPTQSDLITCEYEAIKTGVEIQIKPIANGTAVTEASLNAATVTADLQDIIWPEKGV